METTPHATTAAAEVAPDASPVENTVVAPSSGDDQALEPRATEVVADDAPTLALPVVPTVTALIADASTPELHATGADDPTRELVPQSPAGEWTEHQRENASDDLRIRTASLEAQLASAKSVAERHAARSADVERELAQLRADAERRQHDAENRLGEGVREREALAAAAADLEGKLDRATTQRDQQQAKIAALEHLVNEARGEHGKVSVALAKREREHQAAVHDHQRALAALHAEATAKQQRLELLERENLGAVATGRNAKDALRDAEERAALAARELLAAQADDRDRRIGDLQARLDQAVEDRERNRSALMEIQAQATRDMQETVTVLDELRQNLDDTAAQLAKAEQRGVELELELDRTHDDLGAERKQSQKNIAELGDRVQGLLKERESLSAALTERSALAEELGVQSRSQADAIAHQLAAAARLSKVAKDRETDLSRLKGELEARMTELNDSRATARRVDAEFRELKSHFQRVTAEKDAKEREYVTLRSRLETELTELRSAVEDRDRRTASLQDGVDKAELRALELEDKLKVGVKEFDTLRARAQEELGQRAQEIRKLREELSVKTAELQKFTTTLQERDRVRSEELTRIEARLLDKDTQVNELLQLLETKTEALRKLEAQRARLADESTTLGQKLEAAIERAKQFGHKLQERSVRASELETELREARQAKVMAEDRTRSHQSERDARQARLGELETATREAKASQQTLELRLRSVTERLDQREAQIAKLEAAALKRASEGTSNRDTVVRELEQGLARSEKERAELELRAREQARELELRSARLAELELTMLDAHPMDLAPTSEAAGSDRQPEVERLQTELRQREARIAELETTAASSLANFAGFEPAPGDALDLAFAATTATHGAPPRSFRRRQTVLVAALGLLAVASFATFRWLNRGTMPIHSETAPTREARVDLKQAGTEATDRVRTLVTSWAGHIERREPALLLALYDSSHRGHARDRAAFERSWVELLAKGDWLSVDLEAMTVSAGANDILVATFPMEIRTAGHLEMGLRELELVAVEGTTLRIRGDRWAAARP